jgi:hypothetical protein
MLEACPGAFINIGNADAVDTCPVHNPHYDFNDAALPIGARLFARLVEKKRRLTFIPCCSWSQEPYGEVANECRRPSALPPGLARRSADRDRQPQPPGHCAPARKTAAGRHLR